MRLLSRASSIASCYFDLKRFHAVSSDAMVDFCFAHVIKPAQVREELKRLAVMVGQLRPNAVLEIGTCGGGTLWLWCQLATPDASIISVDLPRGAFGGGYHQLKTPFYRSFAKPKQSLHLLRHSSHEDATHALVLSRLATRCVQFLFIDGDHSYAGVKQDFEMYREMVEPGGLIAFHDIMPHPNNRQCEVARFWHEIKDAYRHTEIIANHMQGWAGIGVLHI